MGDDTVAILGPILGITFTCIACIGCIVGARACIRKREIERHETAFAEAVAQIPIDTYIVSQSSPLTDIGTRQDTKYILPPQTIVHL